MNSPKLSKQDKTFHSHNSRVAKRFLSDGSKPLKMLAKRLTACQSNKLCLLQKFCLRCCTNNRKIFWSKHIKALEEDIVDFSAIWITGSFNDVPPSIKALSDAISQLKVSLWALVEATFRNKTNYLGHTYTIHVTTSDGQFKPHIHVLLITKPGSPVNYCSMMAKWMGLNAGRYNLSSNKKGDPLDVVRVGQDHEDIRAILNYMKHEQMVLHTELGPIYAKAVTQKRTRLQESCGPLQKRIQSNQIFYKGEKFVKKYPNFCKPDLEKQGFLIHKRP